MAIYKVNEDKNLEAPKFPPEGGGGDSGSLRFIIAGGGTGGHIFPAIAIANAILKQAPQAKILFVGAKGKMEMEKIPQAGFTIQGLDIIGFNRSSLIKNVGLPFKLLRSFIQVRRIFKHFKPTAVIGVGGYSSFPVLRFAQANKVPTFIHESNSFAGKTNIMLGKKAKKIFVASDGMDKFFPANKLLVSGNPVRESISKGTVGREDGIRFFGLDPAKKTVLSIGGSLGAKSINEALEKNLHLFEKNALQLIWQTGKPHAAKGAESARGRDNIWVSDFINQMELAYAAADLVISRSGAMAIAELCVMKKAVIFVPFPFAAEDHQTMNAQNLVNKNAGIIIKDNEAFNLLVPSIVNLSKDENKQQQLKSNISKLAITNADEIIATEILNSI